MADFLDYGSWEASLAYSTLVPVLVVGILIVLFCHEWFQPRRFNSFSNKSKDEGTGFSSKDYTDLARKEIQNDGNNETMETLSHYDANCNLQGLTDADILDLSKKIHYNDLRDLCIGLEFDITWLENLERQYQHDTRQVAEIILNHWKMKDPTASRKAVESLLTKSIPKIPSKIKTETLDKWISSKLSARECRKKLVDYYKRVTCKIQLRPWDKTHYVELRDLYTKVNLLRTVKDRTGTKEIRKETLPGSINDIFKISVDGSLPQRILLQGPAGHGKTTAIAKMAYDWAHEAEGSPFKDIPLVFAITFRRTDKHTSLGKAILSQLLGNMDGVTPEEIEEFLSENEDDCIALLDGYDEFSGSIRTGELEKCPSTLVKVMRYEVLRGNRVLVTSRPYRGEDFDSEDFARVYVKMEIEGFTEDDAEGYINRFFISSPEKAEEMSTYLDEHGTVGAMVNIPFFCMMFCNLWEADLLKGAHTLTGVFNKMLKYLLQHFRGREVAAGRPWLNTISPEQLKSIIYSIGKVSIEGLLGDGKKILFTDVDFADCKTELEFGVSLGLLLKQTTTKESDEWYEMTKTYIEFYHKLAQEHCTGMYLASLNQEKLTHILWQLHSQDKVMDFENVLRFAVGTSSNTCVPILCLLRSFEWKQEGKILNHKHRLLLDILAESAMCDGIVTTELHTHFATSKLDITSVTASTIDGFNKLPEEIKTLIKAIKIDRSTLSVNQTRSLWSNMSACGSLERLSLQSSTLKSDQQPLPSLPLVGTLETSLMTKEAKYSAVFSSVPNVQEIHVRITGEEKVDDVIAEVSRGVRLTKGEQRVLELGYLLFIGKSEPILGESITYLIDHALSCGRGLERILLDNIHVLQGDLIRLVQACRNLPTIRIMSMSCQEFDVPVSKEEADEMMMAMFMKGKRPTIPCELNTFLSGIAAGNIIDVDRKDWEQDFDKCWDDTTMRIYVEYIRVDGAQVLFANKRYPVLRSVPKHEE